MVGADKETYQLKPNNLHVSQKRNDMTETTHRQNCSQVTDKLPKQKQVN